MYFEKVGLIFSISQIRLTTVKSIIYLQLIILKIALTYSSKSFKLVTVQKEIGVFKESPERLQRQ